MIKISKTRQSLFCQISNTVSAFSFALLLAALITPTAHAQFNQQIPDLTPFQMLDAVNQARPEPDENALTFQTQVLEKRGVVLVEFMLPTCSECTSTVKVLKELVANYNGKVQYLRLDINKNPGLGVKYDIPRIPAVLVFKDGHFIEKLAVFTPRQKNQLEATLDDTLGLTDASKPKLAGRDSGPIK